VLNLIIFSLLIIDYYYYYFAFIGPIKLKFWICHWSNRFMKIQLDYSKNPYRKSITKQLPSQIKILFLNVCIPF